MDDRAVQIQNFEQRLSQLRLAFELYFQGNERVPPEGARDDLHRDLIKFQTTAAATKWPTALRYRINTLLHRFTSYDQKWRREMVAIEKGASRRDRLRAAKQKTNIPPPLESPTPMLPPAQGPMDAKEIQTLYNSYLKARKMAGQKTTLSLEGLSQKLKSQLPALQKKHPGKKIDFRVVVENGKAQLKAVVR